MLILYKYLLIKPHLNLNDVKSGRRPPVNHFHQSVKDAWFPSSSAMGIFRLLVKSLISQSTNSLIHNSPSSSSSCYSRNFFTLSSIAQPSIYHCTPRIIHNSFTFYQNHCNFRRRFLFPLSSTFGPLFLSFPPWKLSQSATPLLLGDVVSVNLPKVPSALKLPYKLGFPSTRVLLREDFKKNNKNGASAEEFVQSKLIAAESHAGCAFEVADSYLNLPNFISFSRLLSGPLLGWYTLHFFPVHMLYDYD